MFYTTYTTVRTAIITTLVIVLVFMVGAASIHVIQSVLGTQSDSQRSTTAA
jgi:hypothetical protein